MGGLLSCCTCSPWRLLKSKVPFNVLSALSEHNLKDSPCVSWADRAKPALACYKIIWEITSPVFCLFPSHPLLCPPDTYLPFSFDSPAPLPSAFLGHSCLYQCTSRLTRVCSEVSSRVGEQVQEWDKLFNRNGQLEAVLYFPLICLSWAVSTQRLRHRFGRRNIRDCCWPGTLQERTAGLHSGGAEPSPHQWMQKWIQPSHRESTCTAVSGNLGNRSQDKTRQAHFLKRNVLFAWC